MGLPSSPPPAEPMPGPVVPPGPAPALLAPSPWPAPSGSRLVMSTGDPVEEHAATSQLHASRAQAPAPRRSLDGRAKRRGSRSGRQEGWHRERSEVCVCSIEVSPVKERASVRSRNAGDFSDPHKMSPGARRLAARGVPRSREAMASRSQQGSTRIRDRGSLNPERRVSLRGLRSPRCPPCWSHS